jgi:tetratricopeptide (TPR) repeat protein
LLERASAIYRRLGAARELGLALVHLGRVLAFMGKYEESEAALNEAHALFETTGPWHIVGIFYFNFAYLKSLTGDPRAARDYYQRSLAIDRRRGDEFGVLATMGNLANVTWALGDLPATAASLREQIALLRASPAKTHRLLGWALVSLSAVLTEQGELEQALAAARAGVPLVAEDGSAWIFSDSLALRLGLAGNVGAAARLAGYADRIFALKQATRHPIELKHRARVHALLREKLRAEEVEQLLAEGAELSEDEACRLALQE